MRDGELLREDAHEGRDPVGAVHEGAVQLSGHLEESGLNHLRSGGGRGAETAKEGAGVNERDCWCVFSNQIEGCEWWLEQPGEGGWVVFASGPQEETHLKLKRNFPLRRVVVVMVVVVDVGMVVGCGQS